MNEQECPTCGPTTTEQHPRRQGVMRCANCKEWLTTSDCQHNWTYGDGLRTCGGCGASDPMTTPAEHVSSDEGGEGLTEAERDSLPFGPAYYPAVERILADRLAAVQAEARVERMAAVSLRGITAHATLRAESAESALAAARRDAEGLRARLGAVEVAMECPHGPRHYYAVDATCQRCEMPSWVEALLRAALDNPPAVQREGEGASRPPSFTEAQAASLSALTDVPTFLAPDADGREST